MVLSWFDETPAGTGAVWEWFKAGNDFCGEAPKIVAFGEIGLDEGTRPETAILVRKAMGIEEDGSTQAIGAAATVVEMNGMLGFEVDFLLKPGDYAGIHVSPEGQSLLRIANEGVEVDLGSLGPAGGYLHGSAVVDGDGRGGTFWIVDPFAFFDHVLGTAPWPIPDPTTLGGKRIFFSTITEEGWLDVMPARDFGEPEQLASEVLVEKLIEPFADLPITVAALTGDLEESLGGKAALRGRQAAVRALSRPNVESGTQGYSYVTDWDFFVSYDQSREAEILQQAEDPDQQNALVVSAVQTLGDAFANPGASTFSKAPNAPRKYASEPFNLDTEVGSALEEVQDLAGREGPAGAFVWSGDARPFEAALVAVEDAGVESIGGGGGTYYAGNLSLTGLWPFSAPVGEHLQVYDALSGDAAYTGFWTTPIHGFHAFGETLQRTENPRRLKPFELAFAARSAMFFETRRAVERYFEDARMGDVIPVHAARYARMVRGFQSMRVLPEGQDAWRILDRGSLQTVRFDRVPERVLDLDRSSGVMGARRKGDSLYVALDPNTEAPLVVLAGGGDPTGIARGTAAPGLQSSRVVIDLWQREGCALHVQVSGIIGGELDLVGEPGGAYRVTVTGDTPGPEETVIPDAEGRMSVYVPVGASGQGRASILAACAERA
ncbi:MULTISPECIES: hypothetical protein [unclassified Paracoccus (in: a-proteobacteria)]|uniref:hypothetical protein n=1 Tax=unclassified Paracoccus (in: a-proteobacteria) TaxID=2688777 RepID=UPI0016007D9A|nr:MULTISPECIES: hypothetical protein [unclassified Paracoccus (in: a-proteobacteria)]MBB1491247.1 hypothetical protein [Paracoccus sp. MC1854]MBB1498027.1 hypothetical protein [Paracoccus sp. MC1862]QQO43529.1 hypothetical protein JGR78_08595 [Paracoccus sp. MC1862]